jgi:hypothetical protein
MVSFETNFLEEGFDLGAALAKDAEYGKGGPRPWEDRPSHGQRPEVPLTEPLSSSITLDDNAPRGKLPTSLLNHETSVTSFHALKPDRRFTGGQDRVTRQPYAYV